MSTAPMLTGPVTVRRATVADAPALLELHRKSYDSDRTMDQWRWRYLANPLGQMIIVGAFTNSGECVAAFCGVPLACQFDGEATVICRGGDVAVHPDLQKSVAGPKLLLKVSNMFVQEVGAVGMLAIFGFPAPGLSRTVVGHCRYEVMADINWLTRSATNNALSPVPDLPTVLSDEVPEDADAFLRQWGEPIRSGLLRNRDYLRWRYQNNPEANYQFASVRSASGSLRAMAVLRVDSTLTNTVSLVEYMVPPGDRDAKNAILAAATTTAQRCGRSDIVAGLPGSAPEFQRMQQEHGFRVLVSPYQFVYRSYQPRVSRRFLFENWYFSAGDLDFM